MTAILAAAEDYSRNTGLDMLALVPASKPLFEFYGKRGYHTACFLEQTIITPSAVSKAELSHCDFDLFLDRRRAMLDEKDGYIDLDTAGQAYRFTASNAGDSSILFYRDASYQGYLVGSRGNGVYTIEETDLPLLGACRASYVIMQRECDVKKILAAGFGGQRRPYGMIKTLTSLLTPRELLRAAPYMNLMLQ